MKIRNTQRFKHKGRMVTVTKIAKELEVPVEDLISVLETTGVDVDQAVKTIKNKNKVFTDIEYVLPTQMVRAGQRDVMDVAPDRKPWWELQNVQTGVAGVGNTPSYKQQLNMNRKIFTGE